jgi:ribose transport system substrate-binding protein
MYSQQKVRTIGAIVTVAAISVLGLAGCSSADPGGSGGKDGAVKIGLTISNSTNPFYVKETKTGESYGKSLGASVLSQVANEDVQTQSNQIDQFIASGVSFIIIDPADSDGVGPAVKRAIAAKIPVIAIDNQAANATANVTTDNTQAGQISCKSLAEQLGGKGKIAILNGTEVSAVNDRVTGCKAELKKNYPGITIVADQRGDNSKAGALPIATAILTANPDLAGIFAINDPTATGVVAAAKQKGTDIIITSVDGAASATDVIKAKGLITATAAQDPGELAKQGIDIGMNLLKNKQPAKTDITVPTKLIDASNVASYKPWG